MSSPVRTCVGCRRRGPKADLVRLVWRDGAVVPDPRQRHPGRGAYLHGGSGCLELAVKRRSLGRALKVTALDPDQVLRAWAELPSAVGSGVDPVAPRAAPPVLA
ncbi:MAG: hypothetical protein JWP61_2992 [Friedmanniella sp.]|nr:hypothetical protein [Friedmanniella sp.]